MTGREGWSPPAYTFIVLSILVRTVIQVLFKYLAIGEAGASYVALATSPLFYFICVLFAVLTWSWQHVLSRYPLNFAYPFTSVVFITMLISGAVFFDEVISSNNIYGSLIILAGVALVARDSPSASSGV